MLIGGWEGCKTAAVIHIAVGCKSMRLTYLWKLWLFNFFASLCVQTYASLIALFFWICTNNNIINFASLPTSFYMMSYLADIICRSKINSYFILQTDAIPSQAMQLCQNGGHSWRGSPGGSVWVREHFFSYLWVCLWASTWSCASKITGANSRKLGSSGK